MTGPTVVAVGDVERWQRELDGAEAKLGSLTSTNDDGFDLWRHQVNVLISEIQSPKGTLAIRFNGIEWGRLIARASVWSPDIRTSPVAAGATSQFQKGKATAKGVIETLRWEVDRQMPEQSPLDETSIDPELWGRVRVLVEAGEWDQVALSACVFVEDKLRNWAAIDSSVKGSVNAFKAAVSSDKFSLGDSPSEQQGWQQLATGFALALRNRSGHRIESREDAKRYAFGVLGTASLLLTEIRHVYGETPALPE